jgi:hypothetical protein
MYLLKHFHACGKKTWTFQCSCMKPSPIVVITILSSALWTDTSINFFWIPPLCSHNYTFSEMARVPDLPYDVQASEKVIFGPTRSNLGCNWDLSTLFLEVSLPHIVELGSLTSDMVSKYAWKLPFVLRSTNFNYFFYLVVVPAHNGYEVVI